MTASITPTDLVLLAGYNDRRCYGASPDLFYPREHERWEVARVRLAGTARGYCKPCPLRAPCERAGREGAGGFGMWGGVVFRRNSKNRVVETDLLGGRP